MYTPPVSGRSGATLLELAVLLAIAAAVGALAAPKLGRAVDVARVRSASGDVAAVLATAREKAIAHGVHTTVALDGPGATLATLARDETVSVRRIGRVHGVTLTANRAVVRYTPLGLGYGASNTRIIVTRRRAADTVYVSRLGRVRR